MKAEKRLVLLVPTEQDTADNVYWQNFVWRVMDALKRDGLDCRVCVAARVDEQLSASLVSFVL